MPTRARFAGREAPQNERLEREALVAEADAHFWQAWRSDPVISLPDRHTPEEPQPTRTFAEAQAQLRERVESLQGSSGAGVVEKNDLGELKDLYVSGELSLEEYEAKAEPLVAEEFQREYGADLRL